MTRSGAFSPVFWPGEFHGLCSPCGHKEATRLSDFHFHLTSLVAQMVNSLPAMHGKGLMASLDL